jgi:Asp-tRNA(Asn)/Glu-tRNA(Gln) amidotransferase A subunit family amidase
MPAEIEKIWESGRAWLKTAGAELVEVSLPHTKYALPAYYIVAPAEASSNLARYDGVRYGLRVSGGDITNMYENTRSKGLWRRGAKAGDDRHICPVGRVLRCLLPARPKSKNSDQEGFRGML